MAEFDPLGHTVTGHQAYYLSVNGTDVAAMDRADYDKWLEPDTDA